MDPFAVSADDLLADQGAGGAGGKMPWEVTADDLLGTEPKAAPVYKPVVAGAAQEFLKGGASIGQSLMAGPALVEALVRRYLPGPAPSPTDPTFLGTYLNLQQKQAQADAAAKSYDKRPGVAGFAQEVLDSSAGSLPQMAATLPAGAASNVVKIGVNPALTSAIQAAKAAGIGTFTQEAQDNPTPRGITNAAAQGVLEAVFTKLGGATGIEAVYRHGGEPAVDRSVREALKEFGLDFLKETGEEGGTSTSQELARQAIVDGKINLEQANHAGLVGMGSGGVMSAGMNAPHLAQEVASPVLDQLDAASRRTVAVPGAEPDPTTGVIPVQPSGLPANARAILNRALGRPAVAGMDAVDGSRYGQDGNTDSGRAAAMMGDLLKQLQAEEDAGQQQATNPDAEDFAKVAAERGQTPEQYRANSENDDDVVPQPKGEPVQVAPSAIAGRGVQVTAPRKAGEKIATAITPENNRTEAGRFVNHQQQPTADLVEQPDGTAALVARRDLAPGEEATIDYRQAHQVIDRRRAQQKGPDASLPPSGASPEPANGEVQRPAAGAPPVAPVPAHAPAAPAAPAPAAAQGQGVPSAAAPGVPTVKGSSVTAAPASSPASPESGTKPPAGTGPAPMSTKAVSSTSGFQPGQAVRWTKGKRAGKTGSIVAVRPDGRLHIRLDDGQEAGAKDGIEPSNVEAVEAPADQTTVKTPEDQAATTNQDAPGSRQWWNGDEVEVVGPSSEPGFLEARRLSDGKILTIAGQGRKAEVAAQREEEAKAPKVVTPQVAPLAAVAPAAPKVNPAVAKLRQGAATMTAKAEEDLGRDRLSNTRKRAEQAASAIRDASQRKADATTAQNLADAMERGEVQNLSGVKSLADVVTLRKQLDHATWNTRSTAPDSHRWRNPHNSSYDTTNPTDEEIRKGVKGDGAIEITVHGQWIREALEEAKAKKSKGLPAIRSALGSFIGEKYHAVTEAQIKAIRDLAGMSSHWGSNIKMMMETPMRLRAMGITTKEQLRDALVELNQLRAAVPGESKAAKLEREIRFQKIPGFFPTPPALADLTVSKADIQPGMRVLEPEGGKGDLAQRIEAAGGKVDVAETQHSLREILTAKGFNLVGANMLDMQVPEGGPVYDRVVMNPPFENGQDREHVRHAYDLLKPGGRLVAIMSPGPFQRSFKADQEFKAWVESVGGVVEDNEAGSFAGKEAFRQTGVHTVTLTIDKPEEKKTAQASPAAEAPSKIPGEFGAPYDPAIVNLPLDKRGGGSIDAQLDRYNREQEAKKRAEWKAGQPEREANKATAAELRARLMELPLDRFKSMAEKAGTTPAQARDNLISEAKHSGRGRDLVAKWLDEQAQKAAQQEQTAPAPAESPAVPHPDYMPDSGKPIAPGRWRIVDGQGRIVGVADGQTYAEANANAQAGKIISPTRHHVPKEAPAVEQPAQAPTAQDAAPSTTTAQGDQTEIIVPGRADPIPARYEVRELSDLKASHTAEAGGVITPTPGYPAALQPRDYKADNDEGLKVMRQAAELRPALLVTDAPDATSGPSTVTADGTVINGNSRVMTLQAASPEKRAEYRALLVKKSAGFGIDPKAIEGMKDPVLVRVVDMDPTGPEAQRFARQGNVSMTQAQSPARTAASLGGLVSPEVIDALNLDDDTTFSEAVSGPAGREFRRQLMQSLPASVRTQYLDESTGGLTEAGKELVRDMLLNKVLPVGLIEDLRETRKQLLRSVEGAIPQLLRMQSMPGAAEVKGALVEALNWLAKHPTVKDASGVEVLIGKDGKQLQQRLFDRAENGVNTDTYGTNLPLPGASSDSAPALESRRERYLAEPGQSPVATPEDDEERRRAESPEGRASRELKDLLDGAGVIEPGQHITNLVKGLVERDLASVTLTGAKVESPTDAATLLAAYRSPTMERMTWLLVGADGRVRHHGVWALGDLVGVACPTPEEHRELLDQLGAKPGERMVWCHNHPSGNPDPSREDRAIYRRLVAEIETRGVMHDFLVLDGDKFAQVDPWTGAHEIIPYEATKFRSTEPGRTLDNPDHIAGWIKGVQLSPRASVAMYLDARHRVVGVESWASAPTMAQLRVGRDRAVAFRVVVAVPYGQHGILTGGGPGPAWLLDVVEMTGGGTSRSLRRASVYRVQTTEPDESPGVIRLVMDRQDTGGQTADQVSPEARMMLDFLLRDGGSARKFKQGLAAAIGAIDQRTNSFLEMPGDLADGVADALGVPKAPGATFKPAAGRAFSTKAEESRPVVVNLEAVNKGMTTGRVVQVEPQRWRFVAGPHSIAIRPATSEEMRGASGQAGMYQVNPVTGEPEIVLFPGATEPFTINHELIHYAKAAGLLTASQELALFRLGTKHGLAKEWAGKYRAAYLAAGVPEGSIPAMVREEIAAKTVEAIKAGKIDVKPSFARRLIELAQAVGRFLTGGRIGAKSDEQTAREVVRGDVFKGEGKAMQGEDVARQSIPADQSPGQERIDQSRGVDPSKVPDTRPGILDEFRRHFRHLDPARHAEAIAILRELEARLDAAPGQAERIILGHVDGLTREQAQAFGDRLVMEDVLRQIEAGEFDNGPDSQGRTAQQIAAEIRKDLAKVIEAGGEPAARAYEKRRRFQKAHTEALVRADLLPEEALEDPRYYHRQVLAHLDDKKTMGLGGSEARQRTRGFQKGRSGGTAAEIPFYGDEESRRDFNTNYAQAEFEYLAQSVQELARHDALQQLDARYNVMRQAKAEAKARNRQAMDEWWEQQHTVEGSGERDEEAIAAGWDQPFRQRMAIANSHLAELASFGNFGGPWSHVWEALRNDRMAWHGSNDDLEPADRQPWSFDHPDWWRAISWLAGHPEVTVTTSSMDKWGKSEEREEVPAYQALALLRAINDREQMTKDTLGKKYQTWLDVAKGMEGYALWQPEEGMQLVPGWAATDEAITNALRRAGINDEALADNLPEGVNVAGQLKRSLIVMGKKPEWLIPQEVADQLNSMRRGPDPSALARFMEAATRKWKLGILHLPWRVVKYQLNNLVGDLDVALTEPGLFREVVKDRAKMARDLWSFTHGKPLDADTERLMKAAQEAGILDSGVSAAELPDVDRLPALRGLFGKGWSWDYAGLPEVLKRYFDGAQRFGRWREALMRMGAARHFYREISPKKRRYSASRRDELDQLYDRWAGLQAEADAIARRYDPSEADLAKQAAAIEEGQKIRARIAAKLARELLGDYGNLSHAGTILRRSLIPFWSWAEINAPRYVRLVRNARYEGGSSGARALGVSLGMGAKLGVRMAALTGMVFAWNAMMKAALGMGDDDDPNKDADLSKLVIILGREGDGKVKGIRVSGAMADALGWLDLDNSWKHLKELAQGQREGRLGAAALDVLGDVAKATPNKLAQGMTPLAKVPIEQATGRQLYPDIFKPRPIGNRWEHLAGTVGAQGVAKAVQDRGGWSDAAEASFLSTSDPRTAAAYRIRDQVEAWAGRNGVTLRSGGGEPTERTDALRQARAAFARGEEDRATRWLNRYYDAGGKPGYLASSKAGMHPLASLSNKDRPEFVKSLNANDRAALDRATAQWRDWWDNPDEGFRALATRTFYARKAAPKP